LAGFEISGKSARDMKPFTTLTFCAMLFGGLALAGEPVAVQRSTERSTDSVSFALLTGESFSWTGLYIGGNLGGSLNTYQFNERNIFFDVGQQFNEEFATGFAIEGAHVFDFLVAHQGRTDGTIMGGGQVGGMFQFGHFVVGIEGDFDRLAASDTRAFRATQFMFLEGADFDGDTVAQTTLDERRHVETDWNASVRGKLGWANGPLLFYATGGVAFANVEVWGSSVAHTDFFALNTADTEGIAVPRAERFPGDFNPVPFASAQSTLGSQKRDNTYTGWTAGAGVDLALTDCVTIALEYRHSDFGDHTFHFDDNGGPFFTNSAFNRNHGGSSIGLDSDQVTVRVNLNLVRFFFGH